jgi:Ribbon-helix-helix protein, copG family
MPGFRGLGRDLRRLSVPLWYHIRMAMNLRLTDAEAEALRRKAAEERRSMQEVARAAIAEYVSDRPARLRAAIERVRDEDAELLERLAR